MASNNISANFFMLDKGINMHGIIRIGIFRLTSNYLLFKTMDYAEEASIGFTEDPANVQHLKNIFRCLTTSYGLSPEDFTTTKRLPTVSAGKKLDKSLTQLGSEYMDLYLINFPCSVFIDEYSWMESWMALALINEDFRVDTIGISNFTVKDLMQSIEVIAMGPLLDEIEWQPCLYKRTMIRFCIERNMNLQAYNSFIGSSKRNWDLMDDPLTRAISQKHNATSKQVLIFWALQKGLAIIAPKPYNVIKDVQFPFKLSKREMAVLDKFASFNQKYALKQNWVS